jgi:predicted outer membrane repeat protein
MNTHTTLNVRRTTRLVLFALCIALLAALAGLGTPAHAATVTVQSAADDGTANAANCPGTSCRLRDAIAYATAGDMIDFAGDYTINLTTAQLAISKNLTIDGTGHTIVINGPGASCTTCFRVFNVASGVAFNLQNLTVANGKVTGVSYPDGYGGGLFNLGTTNITNVTFSSNTANMAGGAILNYGNADVTKTAFLNNTATNQGGGVANYVQLTVANSTFSGNSVSGTPYPSGTGAGVFGAGGGTVSIQNSTFSGNSAPNGGADVMQSTGTLTVANTILASTYSCRGTITNGGNNIDGGTSCLFGSTNGSMSSTNPQLGTLTGSPAYFPLNYDSPAIDGVTYNAPNGCPSTDQRGQARDDLACDIGAYEMKITDGNNVKLAPSSSALRTYGPTRAGMQYSGTNPGATTVTKVTNWTTQPANALGVWWEFTPVTGTGLNLTLSLCYSDAELRGLTEGDLRFWRYSGGTWSQVGGAPTLSGTSPNRCAQITGVTDLSRWTLATGDPVNSPTIVTLHSFAARPAGRGNSFSLPLALVGVGAVGGALLRARRRR